ncbi:MAG: hypothetical protein AB1304_06095 [Bacteroidota bacterium]
MMEFLFYWVRSSKNYLGITIQQYHRKLSFISHPLFLFRVIPK